MKYHNPEKLSILNFWDSWNSKNIEYAGELLIGLSLYSSNVQDVESLCCEILSNESFYKIWYCSILAFGHLVRRTGILSSDSIDLINKRRNESILEGAIYNLEDDLMMFHVSTVARKDCG